MEDEEGWGGDFQELRRSLARAAEASHGMANQMRMQLGPEPLPSDVLTLMEDISKAKSLANQLSDRLHRVPLDKLFRGQPMSREEFYLLVALGVLTGVSYAGDPYDDFQMLRYEDHERRSYMTVAQKPPAGKPVARAGCFRRKCVKQLRPEQRSFERHIPELAARFRRCSTATDGDHNQIAPHPMRRQAPRLRSLCI